MKAAIKKYRIITTLEKKRWLLLLCFAITTIVVACDQQKEKKESDGSEGKPSSVSEPIKTQQKAFDRSVLIGDWIWTDAEYRVTISELRDDGTLRAGYFNPN